MQESGQPGHEGMDEAVRRAMRRWPDVPDVSDHLSLDRRGRWLLHGRPIEHRRTIDFINRHYHAGEDGRWWFQNGPQRVRVQLAYTPWIYRWNPADGLETHTGHRVVMPKAAWLDEDGNLLLETEYGIGLIDDRDLPAIADRVRAPDTSQVQDPAVSGILDLHDRQLTIRTIHSAEVPERFGFVPQ
ncbi:DUF2946 family protein [Methylonatrum kenyense]|uniref:DUF2946 family protein n=1 Tax=Methylonatrum kenyense TaxID=455253 RepID=UPI0020BD7AE3|nr:DUF2946 family protein [Methylonatrum kenyense]MCK8515687.1 DUF2946 family protein [Methylonatrum kenyense]